MSSSVVRDDLYAANAKLRAQNANSSMRSNFYEEIGDRVRQLRKIAGKTQVEFAETLGVSLRSLKGYEAGDREIPSSAVLRLCSLCSVSPSWILLGRRDELDAETMELLRQCLVTGLELLRQQSPNATSESWAEFIGVLITMSYAQGKPIGRDDASRILQLMDRL